VEADVMGDRAIDPIGPVFHHIAQIGDADAGDVRQHDRQIVGRTHERGRLPARLASIRAIVTFLGVHAAINPQAAKVRRVRGISFLSFSMSADDVQGLTSEMR